MTDHHSHAHGSKTKTTDHHAHGSHNHEYEGLLDHDDHIENLSSGPSKVTKDMIFWVVGSITLLFCFAELITGMATRSLTLFSDAVHNLSDVLAIGIAWYANKAAKKGVTSRMSYGWVRYETLGGFTNAIFLLALCIYITLEAVERFFSPVEGEKEVLFIIVATFGLIINIFGTLAFAWAGHSHGGHSHSHGHSHGHGHGHEEEEAKAHNKVDVNIRAVFLHYLGDALSSFFVLLTGIFLLAAKGQSWVLYLDPAASMLIVGIILVTAFPLAKTCFFLLLQQTPKEVDLGLLKFEILKIDGVVGVHEFHAWEIVDSKTILSVHIVVLDHVDQSQALRAVQKILHHDGLHSNSIQFEVVQSDSDKAAGATTCKFHCIPKCHEEFCCDSLKHKAAPF